MLGGKFRGCEEVLFILALLIFLNLVAHCAAVDRCKDLATDVRIEHYKRFGVNYPWWYGVGQLKQESQCKADAHAFDGGMGIAQFMPKTAAEISKQMGIPLDPFVARDAVKMQAYFMWQLDKQNKSGYLRYTYQAYNGGWGNLLKEHSRALTWEPFQMQAACQRKTIILKSGAPLSFCETNYDYPVRIEHFAEAFRPGTVTRSMDACPVLLCTRIPYYKCGCF